MEPEKPPEPTNPPGADSKLESAEGHLTCDELREAWPALSLPERIEAFQVLPRLEAEDLFLSIDARDQAEILRSLPANERRAWFRLLAPDDAADLAQEIPHAEREACLALLDDQTRKEVHALLAYAEVDAGGLMHSRYARLRPEMSVDEAIAYLKKQTRERVETLYYVYVLDSEQHLLGVVSLRELFSAQPDKKVRDVMQTDLVKVPETMDQEAVGQLFADHDFIAVPVVDAENKMKGIVTVDDIVDVVQEEATEDAQKFGGMEALDAPYLVIGFWEMVKKRAGWLAILFVGEMFTASAMGYFEDEIKKAVVLALFIPLIISSGGNSGSQASTLVIRAMALGEVRLTDWWRVIRRELGAGLVLGAILGSIGLTRILIWQSVFHVYGDHSTLIALTVAFSLIGVVIFGTLAGSMLPFVLRKVGFDPASASAPFVATLVDVTGLVIYFSVALVVLKGTLLP
jgi:magnesium transporter